MKKQIRFNKVRWNEMMANEMINGWNKYNAMN